MEADGTEDRLLQNCVGCGRELHHLCSKQPSAPRLQELHVLGTLLQFALEIRD